MSVESGIASEAEPLLIINIYKSRVLFQDRDRDESGEAGECRDEKSSGRR